MRKPRPIYKYTRISDDLKNSIKESYLWFSTSEFLNDPFDLVFRLSDTFMKETLSQAAQEMHRDVIEKGKEIGRDIDAGHLLSTSIALLDTEWFIENSRDFFNKSFPYSVCCFTKSESNILMWSHYAENHKGVCLIYDLKETPEIWKFLFPVKYRKTFPIPENMDEIPTKSLLTKSPEWAYEKEWRILYLMDQGKIPVNRESFKGIIFGCRTDANQVRDLIKFCYDCGFKNLEFYRMQKDRKEFNLIKNKLTIPNYFSNT